MAYEKLILKDVELEGCWDEEAGCGRMHLKFADCSAHAVDDNGKELGGVMGCVGGGIEISLKDEDPKNTYYLSSYAIWNAFVRAKGRPELVMEKSDDGAFFCARLSG